MVERDGVKVFVENSSLELLAGITIDFVVAIEGAGFTFDNPNATHSCSCGKSSDKQFRLNFPDVNAERFKTMQTMLWKPNPKPRPRPSVFVASVK